MYHLHKKLTNYIIYLCSDSKEEKNMLLVLQKVGFSVYLKNKFKKFITRKLLERVLI